MSSIIGSLLSSRHCFIKSTMRGECASSKLGKNKAVNTIMCWKFMPRKRNPKCIMPWLDWNKGLNSVRLKVYKNRLLKINLFKRNDCFLIQFYLLNFFIYWEMILIIKWKKWEKQKKDTKIIYFILLNFLKLQNKVI